MRIGRGLFLLATGIPGIFFAACSASNGEPIPSELRDAEALDVGSSVLPGKDGSSPSEDGGTTKDASTKDAPSDAHDAGVTSKSVRINEVYVDRGSGGSQSEFVELRGPEGTPVDDLFLRLVDDNGTATGQAFTVGSSGEKIGPTGTWVIGGALVPGRVDRIVTNPEGWGIDTKGAVQLLRGPSREVLDVVGWTTDPDGGFVPQPVLPPKSTGEGKPYVLPATGTTSFGRTPNAADTDDNQADFCTMAQTNGAANAACQ